MSLEITENHRCDECSSVIRHAEPEHCLCYDHLEEHEKKAFDEGYAQAKKDYDIKD